MSYYEGQVVVKVEDLVTTAGKGSCNPMEPFAIYSTKPKGYAAYHFFEKGIAAGALAKCKIYSKSVYLVLCMWQCFFKAVKKTV